MATTTINGQQVVIRDVWADTLEEEMELIRNAVEEYQWIGMVCHPCLQTALALAMS
jgi:predicted transcriptional regulator